MQNVSELFNTLFEKRSKTVEVRAVINGETYGMGDLYGVQISRDIFADNTPSVGGTRAAELKLSLVPRVKIPRMAEIKIETRITTDTQEAEWIQKGTFYVDTRSNEDGERLDITAYDAMLKSEQLYLELTSFEEWPQTDNDVAAEIASLMGVELDERTELKGYAVPRPQDWTMREVLGYIAASNVGNWTITDDNKLRLINLCNGVSALGANTETGLLFGGNTIIVLSSGYDYDQNREALGTDDETGILFGDTVVLTNADVLRESKEKTNVKRNVEAFRNLGKLNAFTGVTVWWSDESAFTAGDDNGRVLELDCPWATQAMADAILEEIEGYIYQGAEATKAEVTPAAELGDLVVCDGVLFQMAQYTVDYDGSYLPDISAPADDEVDSEYHYESKTARELARRAKLGESYYGVKITRENGIEIVGVKSDDTETSRAVLNADTLEFYDNNGNKVLWFDPTRNKYYFEGDVDVSGQITSPIIEGDEIKVYGFFGVYNPAGTALQGYVGAATGSGDSPTSGVALSYGTKTDRLTDDDNYVIATESGVRMQAGGTRLYVISSGAYVDGDKIATLSDIPNTSNFVTSSDVEDILRQHGLIT